MEYLHNQTGKVLERNIDENEEALMSDVDPEQLDEGFIDDYNDDATVPLVAEFLVVKTQGKLP